MKIFVTTLILFVSISAYAESRLIPEIKIGENVRFNSYGWVRYQYKEDKNKGSIRSNMIRTRNILDIYNWTLFTETEFSNIDGPNVNWLRQFHLSYKINDKWKITAGRVIQPGLYSTPIPYLLQTVKYSRDVFHWYGYGVQAKGNLGNGLNLLLGITGNSDVIFYKEDQFRQAEFSGRLSKWIESLHLNVATTFHVSHDFSMFGADVRYKPNEKLFFRGLVYHSDYLGGELTYGGHLLAEYKALETMWFNGKIHTQVDWQDKEESEFHTDDMIWTNGITFKTQKDRWSITIDHEIYFSGDEPDKSRIIVGAQFCW